MARKKWKITYPGMQITDTFTSQRETYRFIRALAQSRAVGNDIPQHVTVWVDEGLGRGWECFEQVNLDELAGA